MPSNPFSWLGSPPAARYKVGNQSVTWISSLDPPPTPASISPCTKAAALVPPSQRVALFPRRGKLFPPLWTDLVLFLFKSPPLLTSLSDPHCRRWKVSKCCPPVLSLSALLLCCPPVSQIDRLPYFFHLQFQVTNLLSSVGKVTCLPGLFQHLPAQNYRIVLLSSCLLSYAYAFVFCFSWLNYVLREHKNRVIKRQGEI